MTTSNPDPVAAAPPGAPTISVVIPARNSAETIARALASVLGQSFPPDNVVVVDNASSDDTRDRVLAIGDARVVLASGPGDSPAAARNVGLRQASAEWIAFLDADDYWQPGFLELAAEAIHRDPDAVACFGAATHVDDHGHVVARAPMPRVIALPDLGSGRVVPTMSASLVRREAALAKGGFFEEMTHGGEDIDLWLRLAATGRCVGFAEARAVYVVHDERDRARSKDVLEKMERDRELVVERFASTDAAPSLVRRARAITRARTARYWLRADRTREARAAAVSSLRALPTLEGVATLTLAALPSRVRHTALAARRVARARGLPLGR